MGYQHLLVKHEGAITTITLNRPEKRNALSLEVMLELTTAFREVGDGDALGVILAANGPVFSSGHNFADMAGADLSDTRRLFRACTVMMDAVQSIPQPVCAKVHALATAAGCQLVATCDLAVAAEEAAFAIPGGKGGLFCHTPLVAVARNVGRKRALELALTGDPVDARTAAEWGLVNRAVPAERLDEETWDLITRATRGSTQSKGLGKHGFYAQIDLPQDQAYDFAVELMSAAATTAAAQEGIASFLEKRKPVWPA
jgi:enoyl-CoA hydratase/carnithine racemase